MIELLQKTKHIEGRKKIVVAMSGGVDSSTVAALLKHQGHEVIGITLQLYDLGVTLEKKGACCAGQDIYDAQVAAEKIGIPHYVLNYESIFKQEVIEDFADSYIAGETPIPCIKCNQSVKFRDLFKVAKDLDADLLATGHYVQKSINTKGEAELHRGHDSNKDQSYFLYSTTYPQLEYIDFPLGGMTKNETRELAKHFGLAIADKPDSQDICFVPNGNYRQIVNKLRPEASQKGEVVDTNGKVLGMHNGIINFTIGQRRGLGISISSGKPLYVVKIIPDSNTVVVGEEEDLYHNTLMIKDCNWLIPNIARGNQHHTLECEVQLRSQHTPLTASISISAKDPSKAQVLLKQGYKGITPGQACVLYDGTRVIGGGTICRE